MAEDLELRQSRPQDMVAIGRLYPAAFPDEDLQPLVRALLEASPGVLSLVALADRALAGHVVFTPCGIEGWPGKVALLGPLAVDPAQQRRGIGTALVGEGIGRQRDAGILCVYVLGDPGYYRRFGFAPERGVAPPYPLPEAWQGAWQSLRLSGVSPPPSGILSVPPPWRNPALWAP